MNRASVGRFDRALAQACVLGHGVTREAALELEAHAGAFFEQPLEAKRRAEEQR